MTFNASPKIINLKIVYDLVDCNVIEYLKFDLSGNTLSYGYPNKFKFHPPPTDQEKEQILDSYPGNDEGQRILVNVGTLFNIGHLIAI